MFLPFWINVIFVISESAKTQWPTRNKNKIPRIFLSGNSIKEKSGQLTVSEVQLSSSSLQFKRAVYSLLVRQPGKSFDTEQVRTRTLSKRLFLYKHVYLVVYYQWLNLFILDCSFLSNLSNVGGSCIVWCHLTCEIDSRPALLHSFTL